MLSLRDQTTDSEDSSRSNKKTGDSSAPSGSKTSKRRHSDMPHPPRPDSKVPLPPSVDIDVRGSYDGNVAVDFTVEVEGEALEQLWMVQ